MKRRRSGRARFFQILLALTIAMHVFFGIAMFELLRRASFPHPAAGAAVAAMIGVAMFFDRARMMMPDRKRPHWHVRYYDVPFYVHFCAAFFTLLPAAASFVVWPLVSVVAFGEFQLPTGFVMWTYLVGLVLSAYGILYRRRAFVVERVDVRIRNLDQKLDGFRIVQLSDLHVGSLTPNTWAEKWVEAANAENADLAVVTGDMVTSGVDFHEDIAQALGKLRGRLGTFVSMGNHDYFGEGEPLITRLREEGCIVLRNEGMTIEDAGASLHLAAVDDTWTRRADLDRALEGRPRGVPVVLLAHEPNLFDSAVERGVALTLSGHTHGGQVAVPFLVKKASLSHLTNRYNVGIYRRGDAILYVHPGLGTTGPPVRLGVAPAVTVITLRAA